MKKLYPYAVAFMLLVSCQNMKDSKTQDIEFEIQLTEQEKIDGILTPEILWKFGRVSNPQVSPDGKNILYTVTYYELSSNKSRTSLYIVPVTAGSPKKAIDLNGSQFDQKWLTNETYAFLSTHEDEVQAYKKDVHNDEIKKITNIEGGIDGFSISPDQSAILYTKQVKTGADIKDKHKDLPLINAMAYDDLMARHWNHWNDVYCSHIFVALLDKTPILSGTDIMPNETWDAPMSPDFDLNETCWSPDGKLIAYTCKKLAGANAATSTDSDIYLYSVTEKTTKNITQENPGYDRQPVFSPDNRQLAFLRMKTPGYESDIQRIILLNLETGEKQNLTQTFDQSIDNIVWNNDSKSLFFISAYHGTYQIYSMDVFSKDIVKYTEGHHDYQTVAITQDYLIGLKMKQSMSSEIFRIAIEDHSEQQITFTNKSIYDHITMGKSEERWIETTDGKKMLTWVIYPPNFDPNKKYPALLYCQGGPQSVVSQFFSFRWNLQIMAANGYIVVAPNRRGVPSFGEEWNAQISGDYSGQNIQDYLTAIDNVKKEPFVDGNSLGCVGASYGGYSVYYLAGNHQNRFKAFVAHCGMFNFESFYGSTEETFFPNHDLGGAYWDQNNAIAQRSYANSPHKFVENWNTPILVIHGGNDFRIPYTEGLQAFTAARLKGLDARLLYFPEETHFVVKPQNAVLWQREFFGWLDKYLKK